MIYKLIILYITIFQFLSFINNCEGAAVFLDLSGCKNDIECRRAINTQFYLHTREDPAKKINIAVSAHDIRALNSTSFNATKPTKFLVHGYLDSGDTKWLLNMADALLYYNDYNVIRVDWRQGSRTTYSQTIANMRLVALDIVEFIHTLSETLNLEPSNVHCIGHSVGAHLCGNVGIRVKGMGRITGLDPLGSHFTTTVRHKTLGPTDAEFVDVIHTFLEGKEILKGGRTMEPVGNIEIFPNSGKIQPGCTVANNMKSVFTRDFVETARNLVYCSHIRSIEYFTESLLNPQCQWVAYECDDYATFQAAKCYSCGEDNSKCAFLGIRGDEYVNKSRLGAKFYLQTNEKEPYCTQHFVVSVAIAFPIEADSISDGKLTVWLVGTSGQFFKDVQILKKDYPSTKTFLITGDIDVGTITQVDLGWTAASCRLNPFCSNVLYVQGITVSPISQYPESKRLSLEVKACRETDGTPTSIIHKETEYFPVNKECYAI